MLYGTLDNICYVLPTQISNSELLLKISLAPKLCEMYATISLKLFLNFQQHIIEEVNATVEFILLLVNS